MNVKKLTFFIGLLPFLMVLGNSMLIPILPSIQSSLNLSASQTGVILSSFSLPAAVIIPFVGFLSDRLGRKKMIGWSIAFVIGGSVVCGVSVLFHEFAYYILLFGRVAQGIGASGTTPLAMALVGDIFEDGKRAESLGLLEVFNGIGKVAAPIIGAAAALISWNTAFWVFPIVSLIAYIGINKNIGSAPSGRELESFKSYISNFKKAVSDKKLVLFPLFGLGAIGLFLLFGLLYFLSYYIENTYHIDGFFKGFAFLFPLGALTLTSYWTGNAIKENGEKKVAYLFLGASMQVAMFGMMQIFGGFSALLFFITVAFSGLGFILPAINMIITSSVDDGERGLVVSIYGTARFLGVALGPIIYSKWLHHTDEMFKYTFFISFISLLLCFLPAGKRFWFKAMRKVGGV
ncbi:MFS transporter [Falsibacillus albus]|nr:MFS transporter [Falsibacillus albus]